MKWFDCKLEGYDMKKIGGEFWYDPQLMNKTASKLPGFFLGGGQSCLYVICEYLKKVHVNNVLLPSYICPTLLDLFERQGLTYHFYEIHNDFSVDLSALANLLKADQAILFINYFGLSLKKNELKFFRLLKEEGHITIEDNVHDLNVGYTGSFSFNSFRKFSPFSGGYLRTDYNITQIIKKMKVHSNYFSTIRRARELKTAYVLKALGSENIYLDAFHSAEVLYYRTVSSGDMVEMQNIKYLNLDAIKKKRIENYQYLLPKLQRIKAIEGIFSNTEDRIPLGFPVYINTSLRDYLRLELMKQGIFLPVHWDLRGEKRIHSSYAKEISSRILTLVIDQRYTKEDMDRMICQIEKLLGDVNEF